MEGKTTHAEFVFMKLYRFVFIVQDMIYLAVQSSNKYNYKDNPGDLRHLGNWFKSDYWEPEFMTTFVTPDN